jgi:hypothetical protein
VSHGEYVICLILSHAYECIEKGAENNKKY